MGKRRNTKSHWSTWDSCHCALHTRKYNFFIYVSHLKRLKLDWPIAVFTFRFQVIVVLASTLVYNRRGKIRYLYELWSKSDIWDRTNDNKYCTALYCRWRRKKWIEERKTMGNHKIERKQLNIQLNRHIHRNRIAIAEFFESILLLLLLSSSFYVFFFPISILVFFLFLLKTKNMMY